MNDISSEMQLLIRTAEEAAKASYCRYSGFAVGAALLCADGSIYKGCNIENAAFTPTVCAERVAFFKAVSDGKRDFSAIAIVGYNKKADDKLKLFTSPCGVCRQVMAEFCKGDLKIIMSYLNGDDEKITCTTLDELLPMRFSGSQFSK